MRVTRRLLLPLVVFSFALSWRFSVAQVVTATLPMGPYPAGVAINPVTNRIYVVNECTSSNDCSKGTVTVIDGATNNLLTTVAVGTFPTAVAVNSVTNQIYVVNQSGNTVTVIDGVTNNTTPVAVGNLPRAVAVNSVTNQIYVANEDDNTVTVIDGVTNLTTTVSVGYSPTAIAVNSVTNQIYVLTGNFPGEVTVIDAANNNNTTTVTVGYVPYGIAVNSVTNKIYVVNYCGNDTQSCNLGTVTVIDAANNNQTTTVSVGINPSAVAVNSVTNKIYAMNACADSYCYGGSVTVIDGGSNNTTTVGGLPNSNFTNVAVDSVTDKIYFPGSSYHSNYVNVLSVIDGATNTILTVGVGDYPAAVAVNETTHRIYVPNGSDSTLSVIAGDTTLQFIPVTPCRVVDTRNPNGSFGGPPIQGGTSRSFPIPQGTCNIPPSAVAYALNVTVVPSGPLGYLTTWPTSEFQPSTSTLNSLDARVKANAAIVQGGLNAAVSVFASNTTDVILDINGYFTAASNSTLAFFNLSPCRVADTRNPQNPLGGPSLTGGQPRDFPVLDATSCGIPGSAQAYSLNFTVVPHQPLAYLTVWPAGQSQPLVSTLNAPTGTVVANAAIVPAGTGGNISTYATDDTDLIIDINGYFAPASSGLNPLSLYPLQSCRVLDTRYLRGGYFSGELLVDVVDSSCAVSTQAQAYLFNATVVPRVWLGYLTLWADGGNQPTVSTLNALDGAITSNMAIVPNYYGFTDAYSTNFTQLIMDLSGYFAP